MLADHVEQYREEIIAHIVDLVRIRSVREAPLPGMPFGQGCYDVLVRALEMGEAMGFRVHNEGGYAGHIEYGEGEEIVGILNHLDVVPEGTGWTVEPYGGLVRDGRVYGRGTSDNKGPAVISLFCLKALRDAGVPLKRRVRLILGTDEETGWEDMKVYFQRQPLPALGFSPDAGYPMFNREKGILCLRFSAAGTHPAIISLRGGVARNSVPDRCEAVVDVAALAKQADAPITADGPRVSDAAAFEAHIRACGGEITHREGTRWTLFRKGVPAHGANPAAGDNAAAHMLDILAPLCVGGTDPVSRVLNFAREVLGHETDGATLGIAASDEPSGALTLNLGLISCDEQGARLTVDIRYPVTDELSRIVHAAGARAAEYGAKMEVEKHTPALYVPQDAPLIRGLSRAYERATGLPAECLSMGGGTYARTLGGNGVAFGPGFPDTPMDTHGHQADEFCVIDHLMRHMRVCLEGIVELANL